MYIVIELQTDANDQTSTITQNYTDRNEAMSRFHQILSFAALSNVRHHSVVILNERGDMERSEHYEHFTEE